MNSLKKQLEILLNRGAIHIYLLRSIMFFAISSTCHSKAIFNENKIENRHYSIAVAKKKNSNPLQFFTITQLQEDTYLAELELKISGNISYSFATIRLSDFPVNRFGDQEEAGAYFTGAPPIQKGTLGSWTPDSKQTLSKIDGGAFLIKKGTYLVLEIFFKEFPVENLGSVDLYLFKINKNRVAQINIRHFNRFEKTDIKIPPLTERLVLSESYTLQENIRLITIKPTLHLRAVSVQMGYIRAPDNRPEILINIPRYSIYNYKGYKLHSPISLKKGDKLWIRGVYNNSFGNLFNPDPFAEVTHGWKIKDEMLRFSYQYYKD